MKKPAVTSAPIHEIIANRWSGRAFDPDKPVEHDQLMAILEAGHWAPSCFNEQPWCYMIWIRSENEELWQKAFDCLNTGNQSWVKNAPVLMASFAHPFFSYNGKNDRWGEHDTGAASVSMALQAVSMGLMIHQMGGFNPDKLREAFKIPDGYTLMAMIALGWPGYPELLSEKLQEREIEPRERKPLGERFFKGEWGRGIE